MRTLDWMVLLAAVAAIAWVNWYCFIAARATTATVSPSPSGEIRIVVQGGYSPRVVRVKAGQPVRLLFDRRESSSCSEEVVFPDFGIRRFLPASATTAIEITPPSPGRYEFMCGMSMLRGTLIAEA